MGRTPGRTLAGPSHVTPARPACPPCPALSCPAFEAPPAPLLSLCRSVTAKRYSCWSNCVVRTRPSPGCRLWRRSRRLSCRHATRSCRRAAAQLPAWTSSCAACSSRSSSGTCRGRRRQGLERSHLPPLPPPPLPLHILWTASCCLPTRYLSQHLATARTRAGLCEEPRAVAAMGAMTTPPAYLCNQPPPLLRHCSLAPRLHCLQPRTPPPLSKGGAMRGLAQVWARMRCRHNCCRRWPACSSSCSN